MQATSSNFKTTIAGNDVTTDVKVTIALPGSYTDMSLAVESIDVRHELVTDLPDGVQSVTGVNSALATVVLSGLVDQTDATKNAAWLFNPYSTDSPLYRLDPTDSVVVISAGVANKSPSELVPLLTGVVSKVTVDSQAGTVTIECIDNRGLLRSAPGMPGFGAAGMVNQSPDGSILIEMTPGLTGLWPLEFLLRANGIYASTSPRPGCGFYASMVGGAWPQLCGTAFPVYADQTFEYTDEISTSPPLPMQFAAGKWTPQVCRDTAHAVALAVPVILNGAGNGWHTEWGMDCTVPPLAAFGAGSYPPMSVTLCVASPALSNLTSFVLTPVTGTTWSFQCNDFVGHNVTIPAGQHVFDVQVNGVTHKLWMDGTLLGTFTSTVTPPSVTANYVKTNLPYPTEALQVTNETAGTPRTIATPTAVLDAALNMLNATADPGTADAWQIIQQLAEAEGAIAGFDETGLFTFTNRQSLASGASVRTVTAASSLKTLQTEQDSARLATHVKLPVNALSGGAWGNVWNGQGTQQWPTVNGGVYFLHSGETQTLLASWTNPAVIGIVCGVIPPGWIVAGNPKSGYRAARAPDGSGGAITNIQMTVRQTSPTSATITVHNPNPFLAYFTTPPGYPEPAGTPCGIALGGQQFTAISAPQDGVSNAAPTQLVADSQWPPIAEGGAVTNPRGDVQLALPANSWVQDLDSAQAYTDDMLGELYLVKPVWTNVTMIADPSQQLVDRVTVSDPDVTGIGEDAILSLIHTVINATDWSQDVDMRAAAMPGYLLLGVTGRSELNVNAYV